ncbi:MAG: hypothetical protein DRJ05_09085 [Bacteroidetes bacterium]|nr:MAG: hypothetical protein DRJ05_09085 [Bacteroidota bacterium]
MELQINLGVNQVISLIRQLTPDQKVLVKKELDQETITNNQSFENKDLTKLLLAGPIMSKEEEIRFVDFNKEFEKWAKNLSV